MVLMYGRLQAAEGPAAAECDSGTESGELPEEGQPQLQAPPAKAVAEASPPDESARSDSVLVCLRMVTLFDSIAGGQSV